MLVPVLLLLSATPDVQAANKLAKAASWDELYLGFSSAKPETFSQDDRAQISRDLATGCHALIGTDAVMAYSLGDRAAAFDPSADALLCLVHSARKADQRGAAEKALRDGLTRYPKNGLFGLELGRQLLEDHDNEGAQNALAEVPAGAKEHAEAQRLLARARTLMAQESAARRETAQLERRIERGGPLPQVKPAKGAQVAAVEPADLNYSSSVGADGMRTRSNARFVLKYFNDERDFGQRAEYEGRIVDAMEGSFRFTQGLLGRARNQPVDVILYTREEFATHMGARTAQVVAGLYKEGAIRVNDAAELTQETRATLTHEYVHSVIDEAAHNHGERVPTWMNEGLAEYVEWRYLGRDGPPVVEKVDLRGQAKRKELPPLSALAKGPLIAGAQPQLLYAQSAMAMKLLFEKLGPERLLELFAQIGDGAPAQQTLEAALGAPLSHLDEDLASTLASE